MADAAARESFAKGGLANISLADLDHETCYICCRPYIDTRLDPTEEPEMPVQLSCSHVFGKACILRWTEESNTCPTCRAALFPDPKGDSDGASVGSLEPIHNWTDLWYELMGITRPFDLRGGNPRENFCLLRGFPWNMQEARRRQPVSMQLCIVCSCIHEPGSRHCRSASVVRVVEASNDQNRSKFAKRLVSRATRLCYSTITSTFSKLFSRGSAQSAVAAPLASSFSEGAFASDEELFDTRIEIADAAFEVMVDYHNEWIREYMEEVEAG